MALSLLVWESLETWPLAAAVGAVLGAAMLWLYPIRLGRIGMAGALVALLRWMAVGALVASFLKPVFLQPKSAQQWGAVVVLLDRSRSMGVVDSGRSPAERVALAWALGELPSGKRPQAGSALVAQIEQLDSQLQQVLDAQSDLDYARVAGRGVAQKESNLRSAVDQYAAAARTLASQADSFSASPELRQKLADLEAVPAPEARDLWISDARDRQIKNAQQEAIRYQRAADETLYRTNPAVRKRCDELAALTRLQLAQKALLENDGLVAKISGRSTVIGLAIGQGIEPLTLVAGQKPADQLALSADADQSDLAGAVSAAINGLSSTPVRAVVLLSDGRQVGGRGDVTSALRPSGVPVFTVGVAPQQTPDLSIVNVSLDSASASSGQTVAGQVYVRKEGDLKPPTQIQVASSSGTLTFPLVLRSTQPRERNQQEWVADIAVPIRAPPDMQADRIAISVAAEAGEVTDQNNHVERWIKVSAEKMKVAVCSAAPNWDFQFLRAALSQRPWVALESQVLDPEHPRLGLSPQQVLDQDVIVLDDVPVGALDVNQWDAIHSLIVDRGGSVIVAAGAVYPIGDYAQQPIARMLLPFHDANPSWKQWQGEHAAFHFIPTVAGERQALRLGSSADASTLRWQELPAVFRYLQIPSTQLYPDVQKLLLESGSGDPVLLERRLGAGRVLFLGLNETWRWQSRAGESPADQFWRQLVRFAAGEPYAAVSGPLALDLDKPAIGPGEPVHVRARIRDARSPAAAARQCEIEIVRNGKVISRRKLAATGSGHFAGDLTDLAAGDYHVQLRATAADGAAAIVRVALHVAPSSEAEMRDVSGDPAMLARIARASGGQYFPMDQIDRLADKLDAISRTEAQYIRRPLWNSPFLFLFVLGCFACEWALRKRLGLA